MLFLELLAPVARQVEILLLVEKRISPTNLEETCGRIEIPRKYLATTLGTVLVLLKVTCALVKYLQNIWQLYWGAFQSFKKWHVA